MHFLHTLMSALWSAFLLWLYTAFWFVIVGLSKDILRRAAYFTLIGLAVAMFLVVLVSGVLGLFDSTYRGSNVYFALDYNWTDAMRTLVVHAGMLDEVQ